MKNVKILIADEDQNTPVLRSQLVAKGFDVVWKQNGQEAIDVFNSQIFDFCILEMSLPGKDGIAIAKEIKSKNRYIPILFLTNKIQEKDKIAAFKVGCDDYVTKPYSMEELLFRINAILKRVNIVARRQAKQQIIYNIGSLKFNTNRQLIMIDNKILFKLTTKETRLLELLCEYKNRVLERSEALVRIWGDDGYFNARSMDVYITKLRRFLAAEPEVRLLNIHGVGFKLVTNEDDDENCEIDEK